jgi:hypothetical protein
MPTCAIALAAAAFALCAILAARVSIPLDGPWRRIATDTSQSNMLLRLRGQTLQALPY